MTASGRGRLTFWPHPPAWLLVAVGGLVVVALEIGVAGAAFALAGLDPVVAGVVLAAAWPAAR